MFGATKKIGLLDSGLGGLSVMKTLWNETKGTSYIYYADLDNGPYGDLNKETVIAIVRTGFQYLLDKQADAVLLACNSATSAAADFLRETHKIPIFGMEPAVKPASIENPGKAIAVFATKLTLKEEKFQNLLDALPSQNEYLPVSCEGLAKLIDDGNLIAAWDFLNQKIETVISKTNIFVLGCTHYVFLKDKILESYPDALVYDGNLGTSHYMKQIMNLTGEAENALNIILNTTDQHYVAITEEIVSTICGTYTISLSEKLGNVTHGRKNIILI